MFPIIDWKMLLLEGVVFIIIGLIALANPFLMAISLELVIGSLLIIAGIVQGVRALKNLSDQGAVTLLIGAAFALIAGIIMLAYPLTGVLTLTLLMTIFFFVDGLAKVINGWQYRPLKGAGWLIFSGSVSVALAILIWAGLPTSAVWVIGIYFGIYLLFLGISLVTISFYAKRKEI